MEKKEEIEKKDYHVVNLVRKVNNFLSEDKPADVLIIKAHLLCEYYINHLLLLNEICLVKDIESQTFFQKIERVKTIFDFQNPDQRKTYEMIGRLNKLRNKVGHELDYILSESDVDTLGYLQGKQYILDKYDVETDVERLREILTDLVVEVAIILINAVRIQKLKKEEIV